MDLAYGLVQWDELYDRWQKRRAVFSVFKDYADGKHALRYSSNLFKGRYGQQLGSFLGSLRENLCPAVIYGFTESIAIQSWGNETADKQAIELGLSRFEGQLNNAGFRDGNSYTVVWPNKRNERTPYQFVPSEAIPEMDDDDPTQLLWMARMWGDKRRKKLRLAVYTQIGLFRYISKTDWSEDSFGQAVRPDMVPFTDETGDSFVSNSAVGLQMGSAPAFWMKLDAFTQSDPGRSILTDVIPIQDALNKTLSDMIVAGERYAVPLIYLLQYMDNPKMAKNNPYAAAAAGLPLPTDEVAATTKFDPNTQQIFSTNAKGPMGQLDPPDLTRQLQIIDGLANGIGRVVGLPTYYFTGALQDVPSGISLKMLQSRRLARIAKWQRDNGPVLKGMAETLGMPKPAITWAGASIQSDLERYTIALNMKELGYTFDYIAAYLGDANPEELDRVETPLAPSPDNVIGRNKQLEGKADE